MTLRELINASGGPARCASIWGITRESVSRIIKRNSISAGLLEELIKHHRAQQLQIFEVMLNTKDIDFTISSRKSPRSKSDKN